ncbi:type 2 phosphatidylinositol 4,5-bisphosphate 4-phosphatase-like isoform X5 [Oculina patagonica]
MADNFGLSVEPSDSVEPKTSGNALLLQEQVNPNVDPGPPPPFIASPSPQAPGPPPLAYSEMPPYAPPISMSTEPSVICRVCQQLIYIRGRERVVKCPNCQEEDIANFQYIYPPPAGSQRITNLAPTPSVPPAVTVSSSLNRATCGHCNGIFAFRTTSCRARCPHCRETSSVGPDFARRRATIFAIIGFIFLAAGVGVTVGTLEIAKKSGGIYVVWVGAFVAGILNLIRSCYYCTMTVSLIEGEP